MLTGFTFAIMAFTGIAQAQSNDNWSSATGSVRSGADASLCWRDSAWTPATANPACDGALKPAPRAAAPAPRAAAPAPAAAPVASSSKVTLLADALFDFDKATLKPEGKATLDKIARDLGKIKLEVIIAVGNTDSVGSDAYNMALGQRRAQSVKAYLVSKGVDGSRVYTESKGKSNPVASNATAEGRAKNRRTDIEVVGTTAK